MKITTNSQEVFACYSAVCRPPTSGGTGGSKSSGGKGINGGTGNGRAAGSGTDRRNAAADTAAMNKTVAAKSAPAFRSSGRKVLDSSGKEVGTWTRRGDGNVWEIAVKGGQRATLSVNKAIGRDKATSYNADRVSGDTKRQTLELLAKRLADRDADIRTGGKVSDVFTEGVKGLKREQTLQAGSVKANQISVSSNGSVKLKGKPSDYKIVKGRDSRGRSRYQIEGVYKGNSGYTLQSYKTQAGAKMALAKQIRTVQET